MNDGWPQNGFRGFIPKVIENGSLVSGRILLSVYRYLMFFREGGGNAGAKIYMVDITGRVEVPVPSPGFGSDPAWSPLLS